jgi:predicted dehydrogenase
VLPQLGEPKYIEATRASGYSGRSTDIGAVLDLMIHDIDLALSLTRSPLRRVEALGIALLGEREDAANARLTFENGCIVSLNASRVSFRPCRTMQIWTTTAFASLDFAARTAEVVRPSDAVYERRVKAERLAPAERLAIKDSLYQEHLTRHEYQPPAADAITAELADFADSIVMGRAPRVSGEQGRDAVMVAQRILDEIARHRWDGSDDGRIGPLAMPGRGAVLAPHWLAATAGGTPALRPGW